MIAALSCGACGPRSPDEPAFVAPPVGPPVSTEPPTLDGLRVLLGTYGRLEFDEAAIARGCPAGETLGDYLSRLTTYGSPIDDGDVHRLTGGCGEFPERLAPIDPPKDGAYWYCVVDAYTSDPAGESPWHYELRVRVARHDRSLDIRTIACPGAA